MILNIRIAEKAIEYLEREAHLDRETAEDVSQMVVSLCEISGTPDMQYKEEKTLLRSIREMIGKYKDDSDFESHVYKYALGFEDSFAQFIDILEEESQAPEDRLRKAEDLIRSLSLLRAPDRGRSYPSNSLLDEAEQWLKEGEK